MLILHPLVLCNNCHTSVTISNLPVMDKDLRIAAFIRQVSEIHKIFWLLCLLPVSFIEKRTSLQSLELF